MIQKRDIHLRFTMRNDEKKASRDEARIEECNGFEMSEDSSYEDVDNEINTNFLVDKIDHMTEKGREKLRKKTRKRGRMMLETMM